MDRRRGEKKQGESGGSSVCLRGLLEGMQGEVSGAQEENARGLSGEDVQLHYGPELRKTQIK